jgi:hypothetical protein
VAEFITEALLKSAFDENEIDTNTMVCFFFSPSFSCHLFIKSVVVVEPASILCVERCGGVERIVDIAMVAIASAVVRHFVARLRLATTDRSSRFD